MARKDIINTDGSLKYDVIGGFYDQLTVVSSISSSPTIIGQIAIVNGVAYIAVDTSSTSDWKQITN